MTMTTMTTTTTTTTTDRSRKNENENDDDDKTIIEAGNSDASLAYMALFLPSVGPRSSIHPSIRPTIRPSVPPSVQPKGNYEKHRMTETRENRRYSFEIYEN